MIDNESEDLLVEISYWWIIDNLFDVNYLRLSCWLIIDLISIWLIIDPKL